MKNKKEEKALLRRYIDDLYTTEDAHLLMGGAQHSPNDDLLNELASDVWREALSQQPFTDLERERYKKEARQLLKHIEHKKRTWFRRIAIAVASTAAVFCLVLGSITYLNYIDKQQITYQNYIDKQQITYLEASTSYGERKQIHLPDGTLLTLNSCSYVRYPNRFAGKERRIQLEGEGYFKVHRNEKQLFIVNTCRFDVRVLGTCFNVKSYSSDEVVSVDVESGKVQVDLPEAMMRLKAQDRILINVTSGEYSKVHEEHNVAVWRNGGLRFNSTPMRDVAKELERVYNCRIIFAADCEFDNLISGEHDNKNLEAVLKSIEYVSDIKYKRKKGDVIFYK